MSPKFSIFIALSAFCLAFLLTLTSRAEGPAAKDESQVHREQPHRNN